MKKIIITGLATLTLISNIFAFTYKPIFDEMGNSYGWVNGNIHHLTAETSELHIIKTIQNLPCFKISN